MGVVRALVLPVYQRYWLFHAWSEASAADKAVPRTLLSQLQAKVGTARRWQGYGGSGRLVVAHAAPLTHARHTAHLAPCTWCCCSSVVRAACPA